MDGGGILMVSSGPMCKKGVKTNGEGRKNKKKFHIETDPIFDLSCPLHNGRYLINQRRWSGTGWFPFSIQWTHHLVRKDEGIREFSTQIFVRAWMRWWWNTIHDRERELCTWHTQWESTLFPPRFISKTFLSFLSLKIRLSFSTQLFPCLFQIYSANV